jgi:DNA primase
MLRASSLAAKRKLELRVVSLPAGTDPAELIQRDGAQAMAQAVAKSVPFVRFRVERVLAAGDDSSPEGRDRTWEQLRPVFATLPPSAMRLELTKLVSGRLALPESVTERELARAPSRPPSGNPPQGNGKGARRGAFSRREETERAFLALCMACPDEGAAALAALDLQEHFSSGLLRRAASHLRHGDLRDPLAIAPGEEHGPDDDPELKSLLAELIVEAGGEQARPTMLELQRLQLELARIDRGIAQARGTQGSDVNALAEQRKQVKEEFDLAYSRALEETGS